MNFSLFFSYARKGPLRELLLSQGQYIEGPIYIGLYSENEDFIILRLNENFRLRYEPGVRRKVKIEGNNEVFYFNNVIVEQGISRHEEVIQEEENPEKLPILIRFYSKKDRKWIPKKLYPGYTIYSGEKVELPLRFNEGIARYTVPYGEKLKYKPGKYKFLSLLIDSKWYYVKDFYSIKDVALSK
jgi:hypothetical protein